VEQLTFHLPPPQKTKYCHNIKEATDIKLSKNRHKTNLAYRPKPGHQRNGIDEELVLLDAQGYEFLQWNPLVKML
jgi:hypothetical protein